MVCLYFLFVASTPRTRSSRSSMMPLERIRQHQKNFRGDFAVAVSLSKPQSCATAAWLRGRDGFLGKPTSPAAHPATIFNSRPAATVAAPALEAATVLFGLKSVVFGTIFMRQSYVACKHAEAAIAGSLQCSRVHSADPSESGALWS